MSTEMLRRQWRMSFINLIQKRTPLPKGREETALEVRTDILITPDSVPFLPKPTHILIWKALVNVAFDLTHSPAEAKMSQEKLAQEAYCGVRTVQRCLDDLYWFGVLEQRKTSREVGAPKTTYLFYGRRHHGEAGATPDLKHDKVTVFYNRDPYVRHDGVYKTQVPMEKYHVGTANLVMRLKDAFAGAEDLADDPDHAELSSAIQDMLPLFRSRYEDGLFRNDGFEDLNRTIEFIINSPSHAAASIRRDIEQKARFLGSYIRNRIHNWAADNCEEIGITKPGPVIIEDDEYEDFEEEGAA